MEAKKHVFSALEKKVFIECIKKYENIVENKKTDGTSLRSKNDAWGQITREYNASPLTTTQVSTKQLRRLWMNLKQRQRDALTKERQHRLATGGGPPTNDAVTDPDLCAFTQALLVSIPGAIDSDTASEMILEPVIDQLPNEIENVNSTNVNTETTDTPNRSPIQPSQVAPFLVTAIPSEQSQQNPPLSATSKTYQTQKKSVLENEYQDRKARANELHEMELKILNERLREAKASADLAEYVLELRKSAPHPHLCEHGRCNDDQRFQN